MQATMKKLFSSLLIVAGCALAGKADARSVPGDVTLSSLPKEAQSTFAAIQKSGPFAYSKDGVTFGNREKLLPGKPRGYYREYTVKTPGSRDRGARRIVCGGNKERATEHSTAPCYYTADHYASFLRIKESK